MRLFPRLGGIGQSIESMTELYSAPGLSHKDSVQWPANPVIILRG
jgi:hypothetical protein